MKKTRYEKLKEHMEQKAHIAELVKEYRGSENKWDILKEYQGLFSTTGILNLKYLLPNQSDVQDFNTTYLASTVTSAQTPTFTIPYKITFQIDWTNTQAINSFYPLLFIRDGVAADDGTGTVLPSTANGNMFVFGPTSSTQGVLAVTQTSTGTQVDGSYGGANIPLPTAFYTIQEQTVNALQINVYDGANYNSQAYTPITGVFATTSRNIAIFARMVASPATQLFNSVYRVANTVSW